MPRIRSLAAAAGVLLVLAGAGCTSAPTPEPSPTPSPSVTAPAATGDGVLRIGTISALRGEDAGVGAAQVAGTDLAAREINEAGGVNGASVLLYHRDAGDQQALAQLAERGVDAVISADTGLAGAAVEAGIHLISADLVPGLAEGTEADEDFTDRLRRADPGLPETRTAADAYDAVVLAALAATLTGDDGADSIRYGLGLAVLGGIPCGSFGECLHVLESRPDIAYQGVGSGFAAAGA